jgi:dolichol-phosphate mannosyltransferase|tara:strand:+ start:35703 stop:36431 length:729 start_codon:yes stop_codon:yes gene_type:complete
MKKILILIPTLNEAENVEPLANEIFSLGLEIDILFIDDNSPDGTGKILDFISKQNKNVFVKHFDKRYGIGNAHRTGIKWAYKNSYEILITMDSDFTHNPLDILRFLENRNNSDVIVGSRFKNFDEVELNLFRKILSKSANFATRIMLGMAYDSTNAYRLYNLNSIPVEFLNNVYSNSYSFFFESLFILNCNDISISEISVKLYERKSGETKMRFSDAFKSFTMLFHAFKRKKFNRNSIIINK